MSKRYKVFAYLKRRGTHIAMLQETHMNEAEAKALQRRWRGQVYCTTYSAFARGVLIWIRPGVPFQKTGCTIDPEGRFVVVRGRLDGRDLALTSVYAPNVEQGKFLAELSNRLANFMIHPIILGGDFNCIADVGLDRSHPPLKESPVYRLAKQYTTWQTEWGLVDSWRRHNPAGRDYSFFSSIHQLHVRLDTFLCSAATQEAVQGVEYLARTVSDHNPALLTLQWDRAKSSIPTWRLKPEALEEGMFRETIREHITQYFEANHNTASSPLMEWDAFKVVIRGRCIAEMVEVCRT